MIFKLSPRFCPIAAGLLCLVASTFAVAQARSCDNLPHSDHPKATITNGDVTAVIYLPDVKDGYYRGQRFDWSGVVACLAYKGHTYFGGWFRHYDPELNDAITGPVEEFRSPEGAQGYDAAAVGGEFVKIGVGVLRKQDGEPYKFGRAYPLVDNGRWTMHLSKRSVSFQQRLKSPTGVAYLYTKTLELDKHGPVLTLHHTLKNLGEKPIVTDVYDHDFFMLDAQPTGPNITVTLGFMPVPDAPFEPLAKIEGKQIHYLQELQPRKSVAGYLTGYTGAPVEYRTRVEDTVHHFGVEQVGDTGIAKFYYWSVPTTVCPEAYIHLDVAPKQAQKWNIEYRFFAE